MGLLFSSQAAFLVAHRGLLPRARLTRNMKRVKVFDRFYRADPACSEEGTGLGLAIAKSIKGLHGGSISLHSKPGEGAVATLRFPRPGI